MQYSDKEWPHLRDQKTLQSWKLNPACLCMWLIIDDKICSVIFIKVSMHNKTIFNAGEWDRIRKFLNYHKDGYN